MGKQEVTTKCEICDMYISTDRFDPDAFRLPYALIQAILWHHTDSRITNPLHFGHRKFTLIGENGTEVRSVTVENGEIT